MKYIDIPFLSKINKCQTTNRDIIEREERRPEGERSVHGNKECWGKYAAQEVKCSSSWIRHSTRNETAAEKKKQSEKGAQKDLSASLLGWDYCPFIVFIGAQTNVNLLAATFAEGKLKFVVVLIGWIEASRSMCWVLILTCMCFTPLLQEFSSFCITILLHLFCVIDSELSSI